MKSATSATTVPCSECGASCLSQRSTCQCTECREKWRNQLCGGCGTPCALSLSDPDADSVYLYNKPWHNRCINIFHPQVMAVSDNKLRRVHQEILKNCHRKTNSSTFIFHRLSDSDGGDLGGAKIDSTANPAPPLPSTQLNISASSNANSATPISPSLNSPSSFKHMRQNSQENLLKSPRRLTTVEDKEGEEEDDEDGDKFFISTNYATLIYRLKAMGVVQDRTILLKSYLGVAMGKDVVDFFVSSSQCASRSEALILANNMAQAGYFTRVHGSNESFTDDESHLYTVDATPVDHKPRQSHSLSVLSPEEVILKQGYMVKRGSKVKTWKKRWFILTQKELRYYKSEVLPSDLTTRSHRVIKLARNQSSNNDKEDKEDKEFYIECETDSDFVEWSTILIKSTAGSAGGRKSSLKSMDTAHS